MCLWSNIYSTRMYGLPTWSIFEQKDALNLLIPLSNKLFTSFLKKHDMVVWILLFPWPEICILYGNYACTCLIDAFSVVSTVFALTMILISWFMLLLWSQILLDEEKDLAKQQQEALDGNCKKYELLEIVMHGGSIKNLARHYGVNLNDWWVKIHGTAVQSSLCPG